MSANSFSPESKIELEVLNFLYKGVGEIKHMNIPDDSELTKKQHQQLKKYIDTIPLFYLNIIKYTKTLYEEIRLSKLNGKPQTIYIITKRTDPLLVRFFSKKYTEADAPYLFMGKKTDYNIRSDKDKYSKSHPYLFMDKTGTITDGKQDLFEIFDENIEIDIIPPSSPEPSPEPMKMSQPKKQDKSLSPLQPLHRDIGTSPMEPVVYEPVAVETAAAEPVVSQLKPAVAEPVVSQLKPAVAEPVAVETVTELKPENKTHYKLKPVHIDVVHAIPIIPSIKPIHAIPITNKIQTRKTEKKTRTKITLPKKQLKNKMQTKKLSTKKLSTKKLSTKKLLKNKTQTNKKRNITISSSVVL
jgi:hypothetical protein